jgi:hypothetical protein
MRRGYHSDIMLNLMRKGISVSGTGAWALVFGLALAVIFAGTIGCGQPVRPEVPTSAPAYNEELDVLWDAALYVLQKHQFEPDRQDRTAGTITTKPTTSRQWGEFWRQDVDPHDSYSMAEASLQTIQRQATVRFIKGNEGWRVEVQVDVSRLNMPESQITTASSAILAFSGTLPTNEGQSFRDPRLRKNWDLLGRDGAMEERLLDRILSAAGRYPAEDEPAVEEEPAALK